MVDPFLAVFETKRNQAVSGPYRRHWSETPASLSSDVFVFFFRR